MHKLLPDGSTSSGTVAIWRSKRSNRSCVAACNSTIPALENMFCACASLGYPRRKLLCDALNSRLGHTLRVGIAGRRETNGPRDPLGEKTGWTWDSDQITPILPHVTSSHRSSTHVRNGFRILSPLTTGQQYLSASPLWSRSRQWVIRMPRWNRTHALMKQTHSSTLSPA
jgi:hypothetical protein